MITTELQEEVHHAAEALRNQGADWITFYRRIFGLHGVVRHRFPTRESLAEFQRTGAYEQIQKMLTQLRKQPPSDADPDDPTRVITVRLPKSLHESLRVEAHEHHTSMNKLCISKLLQFIDNGKIPADA